VSDKEDDLDGFMRIERRDLDLLFEDTEKLLSLYSGLVDRNRQLQAKVIEVSKQPAERFTSVDWVKGLTIIAITLFHCYEAVYGWPGHDLFGYLWWGLVRAYMIDISSWESVSQGLLKLTGLGYQGVHVFVILSGFLQMWTSRERRTVQYYSRRFLRIYPLYWMAFLGVVTLNLVIYGSPGATFIQLWGVFLGYAPLLSLNPSFWFVMLIVQLYLLFPVLRAVMGRMKEWLFLFGTAVISVVSLFLLARMRPWAGFFVGGWLFEFSLGMVLANHRSGVEARLRGWGSILVSLLVYLLGLGLSNFSQTWPLGRPIYGVALTLFLWSVYNTLRGVDLLDGLNRLLVFVGRNSYAMFLINQPFIQEYYLLFGSPDLAFRNQIIGSPTNFDVLPISRYLMVELNYLTLVVFLSYILTEADKYLIKQISSLKSRKSSRQSTKRIQD
jgi:peptidoglycan/LPS O-acetylase OafA/YrhL